MQGMKNSTKSAQPKRMNMKRQKAWETTRVPDYKLLTVKSDAFTDDGVIPARFTCDGENINPPLHIEGIPEDSLSLAIIVDDPDAPGGSFCHWVNWNIPVTHEIQEKENRGMKGMNDFGEHGYSGPCPPAGVHRYHFKIYALNRTLDISPSSDKMQLESAMSDSVIAFGVITGKYSRQTNKTSR